MVKRFFLFLILPFSLSAQVWEFSNPQPLSSGVNTEYEEAFPLLSPDGKTLYFSRILYPQNDGGKFAGSDIWTTSWDEKQNSWQKASALQKLNDKGNNAVVGISADGNTIYTMKTNSSAKPSGIYFSRKIGTTWSRPELIPVKDLEPKGFLSFYASPDFDVIFISMQGNDTRGEEDLYVTTKNSAGEWNTPKNLGSSINTAGYEFSPFLSADKKRLYFSSNGHKGFGDADIFYCDRLYNSWDTWSAPRNLGEKLNSKGFDAYFSLYGDSIAYFASNRGGRYADIYHVKVVPGNEVLSYGQRYLTTEETAKLLGANVSRRIIFEGGSPDMRPADKELLFYIANKVSPNPEINVQVTVLEEYMPGLTEQRMRSVADQLRASGIENIRLLMTNNDRFKKKSNSQTVMEILLFQ